jgi:hypothetical protein
LSTQQIFIDGQLLADLESAAVSDHGVIFASDINKEPSMRDAVEAGPARKNDGGKPAISLIPPEVLFELGKVLEFGAQKYAARNWEKGLNYDRVFSALQRHLWSWWDPTQPDVDDETGLSHLSHALCNLAFLVHFEQRNRKELDNRPE